MATVVDSHRVRRWLVWSGLWVGVALMLWLIADWMLMSDRGLDLGDEALYLMAADTQSSTASYVFPWGWHTRPLYLLVGGDVAGFRSVGAVVLGLVGIWVGLSTARLIAAARGGADRWVAAAAAVAALAAAWLFYFTLLRAPGYNWVTLVGTGIAVGAALRQWARHIDASVASNHWADRLLVAVIGFGTLFTVTAKPTTAIFIGIAYAITAVAIVGLRRATTALGWVITASVLWIPVLVLIRWWPWSFVDIFIAAVRRPLVTEQQSPPRAFLNFVSIPLFAYRDFRGVAAAPVALAGIAYLALASSIVRHWRHPRLLLIPFLAIVLLTPIFAANTLQIWQQGWERGNLTVALLMVVVASIFIGLGAGSGSQAITRLQLILAVISLTLLAGAFGFSSTNTPYPMIKFAALLLAAAALLPLARVSDNFTRRAIAFTMAIAMTGTTVHLILKSQRSPYSSTSLELQLQPVTVGITPSTIFVDEDKARAISGIRDVIQNAGGEAVRLIAIGPDTPGVAFGSGATMPDSLMLSWFGLPGDVALAEANLSRVNSPEWCNAWLLTRPMKEQTTEIASVFADFTGRQWPADYSLKVRVGMFSLWQPRDPCGSPATPTD